MRGRRGHGAVRESFQPSRLVVGIFDRILLVGRAVAAGGVVKVVVIVADLQLRPLRRPHDLCALFPALRNLQFNSGAGAHARDVDHSIAAHCMAQSGCDSPEAHRRPRAYAGRTHPPRSLMPAR